MKDIYDAFGCSDSMPRELAESLGLTENSPDLGWVWDRVERRRVILEDLSNESFSSQHHLCIGESGAVNIVHDQKHKVIAERFHVWGRECLCASGVDNTCNKRFVWQLGELAGVLDSQHGFSRDSGGCRTDDSWFAFKITVKPTAHFNRTDLAQGWYPHLIGTRVVFEAICRINRLLFSSARKGEKPYGVEEEMVGPDEIRTDSLPPRTYCGLTSLQPKGEASIINYFSLVDQHYR